MKTFSCICGNTVYFENHRCLACGRALGFLPELGQLSALEWAGDGFQALHPAAGGNHYQKCANYAEHNVCNWMVAIDDNQRYCRSCRLNRIIPNLSDAKNLELWYRIECAKRRVLYTFLKLGLAIIGRDRDPTGGLAFEFLADPAPGIEFTDAFGGSRHVLTGHRDGTITINIAEADPRQREEMRVKMNEQYRTLLGHFRHETGHYYWTRLLGAGELLESARALFGDERTDYTQALERYYAEGPQPDWPKQFISAYASAHPWEDWAETWAHYLHMVDTLETAHDYGFSLHGEPFTPPVAALAPGTQYGSGAGATFDDLIEDWSRLTMAMNALNRSMGHADPYPFVLSDQVVNKLYFIHRLIRQTVG